MHNTSPIKHREQSYVRPYVEWTLSSVRQWEEEVCTSMNVYVHTANTPSTLSLSLSRSLPLFHAFFSVSRFGCVLLLSFGVVGMSLIASIITMLYCSPSKFPNNVAYFSFIGLHCTTHTHFSFARACDIRHSTGEGKRCAPSQAIWILMFNFVHSSSSSWLIDSAMFGCGSV